MELNLLKYKRNPYVRNFALSVLEKAPILYSVFAPEKCLGKAKLLTKLKLLKPPQNFEEGEEEEQREEGVKAYSRSVKDDEDVNSEFGKR